MNELGLWPIAGIIMASAVFWMQYVDLKDCLKPEPRIHLLISFVLGIGACWLAIGAFELLGRLGVPDYDRGGRLWTALWCFLLIGPIEEGVKILAAYLIVFRWKEFDEPIDGFVYAAAISLGFASMENYRHLPYLTLWEQIARTAALPLTHTLFGAVWGYGIAHARLAVKARSKRIVWEAGSIILAMALHGLYDFALFAYQSSLATSGLTLILWACVIGRARKLVHGSHSGLPQANG